MPGRRTSSPGTIRPARHEPMPTSACARIDQPDPRPLLDMGRSAGSSAGRAPSPPPRRRQAAAGIDSSPTSIGSSSSARATRPPAAAARDCIEIVRRLQAERPAASPRQGAQIGAAAQPLPEVAGQRPDVRAGPALDLQDRGGAFLVRAVPFDQFESVDLDRPRRELEWLTLSGQLIGPPPAHLHGTERRRALLDRPAEAAQRLQDGLARGRRPIAGDELAVSIVSGRAGAEADRGR